jgi:hypothetical protein
MDHSHQGPEPLRKKVGASAQAPALVKSRPAFAVLRRYLKSRPLRYSRPPAEKGFSLQSLRDLVTRSLEQLDQGEPSPWDLKSEADVRFTPGVISFIQISSQELEKPQVQRLFTKLQGSLRRVSEAERLPSLPGLPTARLCRVVIGGQGAAHIFTFVIVLVGSPTGIFVVGAQHQRVNSG